MTTFWEKCMGPVDASLNSTIASLRSHEDKATGLQLYMDPNRRDQNREASMDRK